MDKIFVERYMNHMNKSQIHRDLEDSIFKYIDLYNKIQQLHALYFRNLKVVDEAFVQSLDDYKDEIHGLKVTHGKLVESLRRELLHYYSLTNNMTKVLRELYTDIGNISTLKHNFLEQSILSTKDKIEIMYHLVNNPDYKKMVAKFRMHLKKFDKMHDERNRRCGYLMLLIDAVKSCQQDLLDNFDVNRYDLMVNVSNQRFIKYIGAQIPFQEKLMSDLVGLETVLKTKALPKLATVISDFKKDHRIDPNFALDDVSDISFRNTFQRYLKLSKAIEATTHSLSNELKGLDARDKNVQKYPAIDLRMQRGWQWNHPKIVKMVAERDALGDLLRKKRLDLSLRESEISFCIKENDALFGVCGGQKGGAGKRKSKKKSKRKGKKRKATDAAKKILEGYFDYRELLQALSANKEKYARVLSELYRVRDALNKNEYIGALDTAVNQLQNQANKARLTQIMAASREADYHDYIRQLTEDNPTLAKLAERNQYASFIMRKGKNSQDDYNEKLEEANVANFNQRSKQIVTSMHNEDLLKKAIKESIFKAFQSNVGRDIFEVAGQDSRYLEQPQQQIFIGGNGIPDLNPMIFNPLSLVGDENRCLQVMNSAHDEIVEELKSMLKLRYNGFELKRNLAKVDVIADRILEDFKKDKCKTPFAPTLAVNLSERFVKLACTIRCQHLDALEAANNKAGLIGRQAHQANSFIYARLKESEVLKLFQLCRESEQLTDKNKMQAALMKCVVQPLVDAGLVVADGSAYRLNDSKLSEFSQQYGINVVDLPARKYDATKAYDVAVMIKDIEAVLDRLIWAERALSDRSQSDAVLAAMCKEKAEKWCTRIHHYARKYLAVLNAKELFNYQSLYNKDEKIVNQRVELFCTAFQNDWITTIQNLDKNDLASVLVDVSNNGEGVADGDYKNNVQELYNLISENARAGSKDKTYIRIYENARNQLKLHQVIQEGDFSKFVELTKQFSKVIKAAESSRPARWTDSVTDQRAVTSMLQPIAGYQSGRTVPTILNNLFNMLQEIDRERYNAQCLKEQADLESLTASETRGDYSSDLKRWKDSYIRASESGAEEHQKCVDATNAVADSVDKHISLLHIFLGVYQILNAGVYCLINEMVPKEQRITCAKATVGNNMDITALVELGRRLHAIADSGVTRKILSANDLKAEIQQLTADWSANYDDIMLGLNDYLTKVKAVVDAQKKMTRSDNLLEYIEKGDKLKEVGELLSAQRDRSRSEETLKLRVHILERNANQHHRNISKSFNRYRALIGTQTDSMALLKQVMKFIELWNKCYGASSGVGDPLQQLFARVGGLDTMSKQIRLSIRKYSMLKPPATIANAVTDMTVTGLKLAESIPQAK